MSDVQRKDSSPPPLRSVGRGAGRSARRAGPCYSASSQRPPSSPSSAAARRSAAQEPSSGDPLLPKFEKSLTANPADWVSRERLGSTLQMVLTMSVLSLAPAVLLMTTSFIRITVVLGLLRQALGIGQLPSNQVITSIALFMTLLIMTPVWKDVYQDASGRTPIRRER